MIANAIAVVLSSINIRNDFNIIFKQTQQIQLKEELHDYSTDIR